MIYEKSFTYRVVYIIHHYFVEIPIAICKYSSGSVIVERVDPEDYGMSISNTNLSDTVKSITDHWCKFPPSEEYQPNIYMSIKITPARGSLGDINEPIKHELFWKSTEKPQ